MHKFQKVFCLLALIGLDPLSARATTFLQFQSTYLGDGWFKYHVAMMNDPFFYEADLTGFEIAFTNQVDQVGTVDWFNDTYTNSGTSWQFNTNPPPRPWNRTFFARSSETHFRLATNNSSGAIAMLSLWLTQDNPLAGGVYSANIVGYAAMPCLVPCAAADADDSPPNFVFDLKLLPDVQITDLLHDGRHVHGIDFKWDYSSTFLLQGSHDLVNWADLAYVPSDPPETAWETNQPLESAGPYFRLQLVAEGHPDNLPPLGSKLATPTLTMTTKAANPEMPQVTGCRRSGEKMIVTVKGSAGQDCQVQALDNRGTIAQTQTATMDGTTGTATFDQAGLPVPVFFRANSQ